MDLSLLLENALVGARQRFEHMSNSDREIAHVYVQIEAMCGLARDPRFDQPPLIGLPETILVLFARDKLG